MTELGSAQATASPTITSTESFTFYFFCCILLSVWQVSIYKIICLMAAAGTSCWLIYTQTIIEFHSEKIICLLLKNAEEFNSSFQPELLSA